MTRVYIGLGSNLGEPVRHVLQAIDELASLPGVSAVTASSLYRSTPQGPVDQPDYVNAVARLETALSATDLLDKLQALEAAHGRVRGRRWGPRTLDLDILLYGEVVMDEPRLTIPHPQLAHRSFVLEPLLELDPDIVIPGLGPATALPGRTDGRIDEKL